MFTVFCELPSSKPVSWAWSLNLSKTCILSITDAGKFLSAAVASSPKKSLPSTVTFLTCSPMAVTVPSLATVIPGSFLIMSSAVASGFTLNWAALNSVVSPFCRAGAALATTVTSPRSVAIFPKVKGIGSLLLACKLIRCSIFS